MKMFLMISLWLSLGTPLSMASGRLFDLKVENIDGKMVSMSDFKGKVLLIVNTASNCGYTPQYEGLETVYQKYKDRGLVVLGFPSNDFGGQEPGSNQEIKKFCDAKVGKYKISFPLFAKSSVNPKHFGPKTKVKINPVYQFLTSSPAHPGDIAWNFEKFVVDKNGNIVGRFNSKVTPQDPEVIKTIETNL